MLVYQLVKDLLFYFRNSFLWTPLDCAAARGHSKVAAILLEFDSPVDPTDKAKVHTVHMHVNNSCIYHQLLFHHLFVESDPEL